ncbi:MAG TPA: endonuclease III [bacterium]|mgnify:CR=1 FL=1|nr:endonuclease III [bacterium]
MDPNQANLRSRASKILKKLSRLYPGAGCELEFKNPIELLVSTILSAQCTDARVNRVTPVLFRRYRTAADFAKAGTAELEAMIRPTGFYRNKARSIKGCCEAIVIKHGGEVPKGINDLVALPGVGRKTANLVRAYAFGRPGIICDTHVLRVCKRLALTREKNPDRVEADLSVIIPPKEWTRFSTVVMWHGRRTCTARAPSCASCGLLGLCPFGQKAA